MDIEKVINSRKSVRDFSSKKPDWRDIIEAIDSMRKAPAAGNNFTIRTIVVENPKSIQVIKEACQQEFVGQTQYIVVVCSDNFKLVNEFGKKGKDFNKQQVGAAIQNFLLFLENRKIATCWVGYFEENEIKNELKIPDNVEVEAIFPIGYESKIKPSKKRLDTDLDNYLFFHKYKNKKMRTPAKTE